MSYNIESQISRPGVITAQVVQDKGSIVDEVQTVAKLDETLQSSASSIKATAVSVVGKSAWEYAKEGGYPGSEEQFAIDLNRIHKTIELEHIYKLPSLGDSHTLYVITDEGASYVWLDDALRFVCVGRDYTKVSLINGNQ